MLFKKGIISVVLPECNACWKTRRDSEVFYMLFVFRCVICMLDFVYGDPIRFLPCMHIYHMDCIDDWLMRSFTCPSCMEPVDAALLSTYETNWFFTTPHPRLDQIWPLPVPQTTHKPDNFPLTEWEELRNMCWLLSCTLNISKFPQFMSAVLQWLNKLVLNISYMNQWEDISRRPCMIVCHAEAVSSVAPNSEYMWILCVWALPTWAGLSGFCPQLTPVHHHSQQVIVWTDK